MGLIWNYCSHYLIKGAFVVVFSAIEWNGVGFRFCILLSHPSKLIHSWHERTCLRAIQKFQSERMENGKQISREDFSKVELHTEIHFTHCSVVIPLFLLCISFFVHSTCRPSSITFVPHLSHTFFLGGTNTFLPLNPYSDSLRWLSMRLRPEKMFAIVFEWAFFFQNKNNESSPILLE